MQISKKVNNKMESVNHEVLLKIIKRRPLVIAGPCSAESRSQVLETAQALKTIGSVGLLRAGVWKPRTRPGNFEGMGEVAFPWMQEAMQLTGIPFMVEVANAQQVETALKYNTPVLWIGARSTANPFSVQEIADALKGIDIPIFIKNPTNPDVELWVGAVERIQKAGIQTIGLIHRGFSYFGSSEYRNAPTWQLALEMKRRFPKLPFLVDPSHICGNRQLLQGVIQKAVDLNYDGLMLESHIRPNEALSDAQQQITPKVFEQMLQQIIWRKEKSERTETQSELDHFRRMLDYVDDDLLSLLGRRMKIAEEIGDFKRTHNLTILQTERWNETLSRLTANGQKFRLSPNFIKQFYDALHFESIRHQDRVMND